MFEIAEWCQMHQRTESSDEDQHGAVQLNDLDYTSFTQCFGWNCKETFKEWEQKRLVK